MTSKQRVAVIGIVFLSLLRLGSAQSAPDATANPELPTRDEVLKFLDLMHSRQQMTLIINGMAAQFKGEAEEGFKKKVPNATPEQLAKVDALFGDLFKSLPVDEMIEAIVPIYQKHLTKSDLTAATAFYSSPAGQRILKEMPAISSEAMQAGGQIGQRSFAAMADKFEKQVDELIQESTK